MARLGESLSARLASASKPEHQPQQQQQQQQRSFDDDLRERECLLGCGRELTRALALQHQLVVLWPSDPSNGQSAVQSAALLEALASLGLRLRPSASPNSPAACAAPAAVALGLGMQLVFTHRFLLPCTHDEHSSDPSSSSYALPGCCDREAADADAAVVEFGAVHTSDTLDGSRTFGCLLVQLDPLALHLLGIEDARLLPLFERVTLNEEDAAAELPLLSPVRSPSSVTSASLAPAGDNRPLLENLTPLRCGFCSAAQSDTAELRSQFQFSHLVSLRAALTSSTRSPNANANEYGYENANGIEKGKGNEEDTDAGPEALTDLSVRASRLTLPFCSCSVVRQMTLSARVELFEQEWWVRRDEAHACWRTHLLLAIEALCSSSAASSVSMLTLFRVSNVFLPEPYLDARPDQVNNKLSLGVELCFRAGAREHALHFLALVANHCARLFHLVIR